LVELIGQIYPNYLSNINSIHHQGDEAITSAAVMLMQKNGNCIADAGTLGIVGRYWNRPIAHPQKPFGWFQQCFLLHLPADKRFLEKMGRAQQETQPELLREYLNHKGSLLSVLKLGLRSIKGGLRRRLV
jgi:hypothetical protein